MDSGLAYLERRRAELRADIEAATPEVPLGWLDEQALAGRLRRHELEMRALEAEVAITLAEVDRRGLPVGDGHRSVSSWARGQVRWSRADAAWRVKVAKLLAAEPEVAERLLDGRLGVAQVRELARVRANPRCGEQLTGEALVLLMDLAVKHGYEDWARLVAHWVRLADADGAHRDHERAHERRGVWWSTTGAVTELRGRFGNVQGAQLVEVLEVFAAAEREADLAEARARRGNDREGDAPWDPDELPPPLARSACQRRADALVAALLQAADGGGAEPRAGAAAGPTVNVLIDHETLAQAVGDAAAGRVRPDTGSRDPRRRQCVTDRGLLIDPADALAALWIGRIRRVVLDGAGRVIDLGRRRRLFTGAAREAVWLQGCGCGWAGCDLHPAQVDHLTPWSEGGSTDPTNGDLACGWHNRWKERHGYRTWRDAEGCWHIVRPDGTEIDPL